MKILIDSFNNVIQNPAGGVQIRIGNYVKFFNKTTTEHTVKLYNKWEDKLEDYDVLHVFKATIDSYNLCALAKKKGLKIVISAVIPPENSIKIKLLLNMPSSCQRLLKKMFDLSDYIVCQTKKEADFITKIYKVSNSKIHVIPNGVDLKFKDCNPDIFRERYNIKGEFALQVGRFDSNKNQLSVIRAVKNTDIQMVFIGGEDPNEKEYYEKCEIEATDNVKLLGWIENGGDMLASAYNAAKVTILPSYSEIFGNSLMEGGMAGCNLIVTQALPIEEWGLEEKCLSIDPRKVDDIKKVIIKSMSMDRDKSVTNIIEQNFSWPRVVNKYIDLYKD